MAATDEGVQIGMGKTLEGAVPTRCADLASMPHHLLPVVVATALGMSVFINQIIMSILFKSIRRGCPGSILIEPKKKIETLTLY